MGSKAGKLMADELRYDLYSVKKGWNLAGKADRGRICRQIQSDIGLMRQDHPDMTHQQLFNSLFDRFLKDFRASREDEKGNYLAFIADTTFFITVRDGIGVRGRDIFTLTDVRFADFFNSIPAGYKKLRMAVSLGMIEFLTVKMQRMIFEMVQKDKQMLEYKYIVKGIFTGAVRYDETVYGVLCREIQRCDNDLLETASMDNPVYVIGILYARGLIDEYELRRYRDYCNRSRMLCVCIYPELFAREDYRKEWKELLYSPGIASCIVKKSVCLEI